MKNSVDSFFKIAIFYLTVIFLASCASVSFKYGTMNHAAHVDGIYSTIPTVKIDTLSEFQFRNKLRNDLSFRLDFAQYALSQPRSFDWNNRLLGSRYNRYNYGYNYYWNRDQMWNDWAWGFPHFSPHRWSPFGFDRWGYNSWINNSYYAYGWNHYGWNRYNNWNNWNYYPNYNRRQSTAYINGRRGSTNIRVNNNRNRVIRTRTGTVGNTLTVDKEAEKLRVKVKNRRIINNNNDQTIRNTPRGYGRPESSNNGGRSRVRENVPTKPVRVRQSSQPQPRQIRRGSGSPVLQQTRTSSQPSSQGRSSSSRRKN